LARFSMPGMTGTGPREERIRAADCRRFASAVAGRGSGAIPAVGAYFSATMYAIQPWHASPRFDGVNSSLPSPVSSSVPSQ
jgi:hypothetical protein